MRISATVRSSDDSHEADVETDGNPRRLGIPPRTALPGSVVSGAELLFLALATCFANDVYREAAREGVRVDDVRVTVDGSFDGPGSAGRDLSYDVRVLSPENPERIRALLRHTDTVAEVHATLRQGAEIPLSRVTVDRA